jgi:hypothetical protein
MSSNLSAYDRCFKKRAFFSREAAEEHLRHLWTQHGSSDMQIYSCSIGHGGEHFHTGHRVPEQVQKSLGRMRTYGRDTFVTKDESH